MSDMPAKRSGIRKWGLRILIGAVALVAVLTATYLIIDARLESRWKAFVQEMNDRGEPLTFDEIEAARAPLPDEKNGARVLRGIMDDLAVSDDEAQRFGSFSSVFKGTTQSDLEQYRSVVDEYADVLVSLDQLHNRPVGRFELEPGLEYFDIMVPAWKDLRTLSKLLRTQAIVQLADGELRAAARSAQLGFHLAGSLHEHPMTVSRLVQLAMEALAANTVEDILTTGILESDQLAALRDVIQWHERNGTLIWALRGERTFILTLLEFDADELHQMPEVEVFTLLPDLFTNLNRMAVADGFSAMMEVSENHRALIAAALQVEQEAGELSWLYTFARLLLPTMSRAAELNAQLIGQLRVADAGLAAEQFRMDKGRLPDSLDELVPDYLDSVPADPFFDGPVRLAITEYGIVLYSIGINETDDGGNLDHSGGPNAYWDVGFRLRRPELREFTIVAEGRDVP